MPIAKVRIFWVHRDDLICVKINVDGVEQVGGFKDAPFAHSDAWAKVVRQHPELRGQEYFEVARGRILFDANVGRYRILTSRQLAKDERLIARLVTTFHLPRDYEVVADEHYEAEPDLDPD